MSTYIALQAQASPSGFVKVKALLYDRTITPGPADDFDHPWLIRRVPEEVLGRYRRAMFRVRSSNEPLVILDALTDMHETLEQVERAAVNEARANGATWSQVAQAMNRTRQAVEQRFG